jgi:hypothetical protein
MSRADDHVPIPDLKKYVVAPGVYPLLESDFAPFL